MPLTDDPASSRVPAPVKTPSLRRGVIRTGWIAERFLDGLQSQRRQRVVAVGSRTDAGRVRSVMTLSPAAS